jgi:hypothetical protein
MVRSLFDYWLFIFPVQSNKNQRSLLNIQDCALRIIYKKDLILIPKICTILKFPAELETLDSHSKNLLSNYFTSKSVNSKRLSKDLLVEFENFKQISKIKIKYY